LVGADVDIDGSASGGFGDVETALVIEAEGDRVLDHGFASPEGEGEALCGHVSCGIRGWGLCDDRVGWSEGGEENARRYEPECAMKSAVHELGESLERGEYGKMERGAV